MTVGAGLASVPAQPMAVSRKTARPSPAAEYRELRCVTVVVIGDR